MEKDEETKGVGEREKTEAMRDFIEYYFDPSITPPP